MGTLSETYRRGWQALAEGRLEDLLDMYAPDVEVKDTGRTFRGREEVRAQYQTDRCVNAAHGRTRLASSMEA
jgi:hypothetical protein